VVRIEGAKPILGKGHEQPASQKVAVAVSEIEIQPVVGAERRAGRLPILECGRKVGQSHTAERVSVGVAHGLLERQPFQVPNRSLSQRDVDAGRRIGPTQPALEVRQRRAKYREGVHRILARDPDASEVHGSNRNVGDTRDLDCAIVSRPPARIEAVPSRVGLGIDRDDLAAVRKLPVATGRARPIQVPTGSRRAHDQCPVEGKAALRSIEPSKVEASQDRCALRVAVGDDRVRGSRYRESSRKMSGGGVSREE